LSRISEPSPVTLMPPPVLASRRLRSMRWPPPLSPTSEMPNAKPRMLQSRIVAFERWWAQIPTVVVAVNYARVPKKRPRLCAKTIRERDGNSCQYSGKLLRPDEGSLDHVLPRSRGGKDEWGNLVWSDRTVNARKGNRLPHEAGLKLLTVSRAPKELPVTTLIRNAHGIVDWKLFVKE